MVCSAAVIVLDCGALATMNSEAGGGVDIDVVHADAGAGDDAQPGGVAQQLGVELGGRADEDGVEFADPRRQLADVPVEAAFDLEAGRAEQLLAPAADLLSDEHPG